GAATPLPQGLRRKVRPDHLVDLVLAECCLVSFEAQAPQPTTDIHDRALDGRAYDHPLETARLDDYWASDVLARPGGRFMRPPGSPGGRSPFRRDYPSRG